MPNESMALMMRRLFIFACLTLVCLIIASVAMGFVVSETPTTRALRVATLIQDVVVFIAPALIAAVIFSRYPARFLCLERSPRIWTIVFAVVALLVSAPFQNVVIEWNESLRLPDALSSIARWMQESESRAQASLELLQGGTSVADLVMGLLIMGVLAGMSEEIFFRGALQGILMRDNRSAHAAIWVAAFIFSAFHFQFYGFIPRMLLGAFFGYLVWWSGSLWLAVIVHALNNSVVVYSKWNADRLGTEDPISHIGLDNPMIVIASVVVTTAAIWAVYRSTRHNAG